MSGIFPSSGVPANQAANTVVTDTVNCTALFHSTQRCAPRFDPASANAVLSEILNTVAASGLDYDCNILTNLRGAIQLMISTAVASYSPCNTTAASAAEIAAMAANLNTLKVTVCNNDGTPSLVSLNGTQLAQLLSNSGPPVLTPKGAPILITASGTYTPTGADVVAVNIEIVGGGGGTPDIPANSTNASSGGNAAGYAQRKVLGNIGPAAVTIGVGGIAASLSAGAGGTSTFVMASAGVNMIAHGGYGGQVPPVFGIPPRVRNAYPISPYSTASGGDVHVPGQFGGPAFQSSQAVSGGHGGSSPMGLGGYGESWGGPNSSGTDGGNGQGFGAGAGGGSALDSGVNGGTGSPGAVRIQEYTV